MTTNIFVIEFPNGKFFNPDNSSNIFVSTVNEAYQYMDESDAIDALADFNAFNDIRSKEMRGSVESKTISI